MRNEKLGYKIREITLQRVPYILVVGEQEQTNGSVDVRARGGENLGKLDLPSMLERLAQDMARKGRIA